MQIFIIKETRWVNGRTSEDQWLCYALRLTTWECSRIRTRISVPDWKVSSKYLDYGCIVGNGKHHTINKKPKKSKIKIEIRQIYSLNSNILWSRQELIIWHNHRVCRAKSILRGKICSKYRPHIPSLQARSDRLRRRTCAIFYWTSLIGWDSDYYAIGCHQYVPDRIYRSP